MTDDAARVTAVVPVFRPDESLVDLVAALAAQCDAVVLVDDTGSSEADDPTGQGAAVDRLDLLGRLERLERCRAAGAEVIRHETNRGIATALNTGVSQAFSQQPGADAVVTVDQDSVVTADLVRRLVDAWRQAQQAGLDVGLVAPQHVEGLPDQTHTASMGVLLGRDPIQSGLLVPATTWSAVGGFDEGLFIDGVDTDFALRVLDARLAVVLAPGLRLGHRLGTSAEVGGVKVTRSATFRYYYLTRNRVLLLRRYARPHPHWAAGQVVGVAGHLGKVLALTPQRRAVLREVRHGIRDGVRGVTGRRPPG